MAAAFSLVEVALGPGNQCFLSGAASGPVAARFQQQSGRFSADHRRQHHHSCPGGSARHACCRIAECLVGQFRVNTPFRSRPLGLSAGTTTATTTLYFGSSLQQFYVTPGPSPTPSSTSRYRLTATFFPPSSGRTATGVTLQVTWPATVDPVAAPKNLAGRVQVFGTLNRN